MGLFDSLFGGYKVKENCPNCDCTFEAEVSDSQPIFYCPDCGYMNDWSMAPDTSYSYLKDSTVRLYRKLIEGLSERTVENELEVLVFAMFVMKDKVMDMYYATQGKERYKQVLSKFYEDLLHYAVNQIYLKGKTAKEEGVDDFIDNFCDVLVPERNIQYDESSRAYSLRVLKEGLNDIYRGPIETFLDNLDGQHDGDLLTLHLSIQLHIIGALHKLAAVETHNKK